METPDKIVRALRRLSVETGSLACLGCGHEHNCSTHGCAILRSAADLIVELNDFDQTQSKIALERWQRAEAQLAVSQRREQAAVADIEKMMRICEKGSCHFCANGDCTDSPHCSPKWRGPQEDGKGGSNEKDV